MDEYDDGPENDFCLDCNDSIQYVAYRDLWMSVTQMENCEICPATGRHHRRSYSV